MIPDIRVILGLCLLAVALSFLASIEHRRLRILRRKLRRYRWSNTVGAWCARRRMVKGFLTRRYALIRVGRPDEHSRGIMVSRRDINAGNWT